jgi:RimJ/RimL family protein N-acetyltransferase
MYIFLRYLKNKLPLIWSIFEIVNNALVRAVLQKKRYAIDACVLSQPSSQGIVYRSCKPSDATRISLFFQELGPDDRKYFSPFEFNLERIKAILRSSGFLFFSAERGNRIVGVFFLRFFFDGRAFLGFVVHKDARGLGIGKSMVSALKKGCLESGIRLFSSVSMQNIPSWKIHESCGFKIKKRINGEYMLLCAE